MRPIAKSAKRQVISTESSHIVNKTIRLYHNAVLPNSPPLALSDLSAYTSLLLPESPKKYRGKNGQNYIKKKFDVFSILSMLSSFFRTPLPPLSANDSICQTTLFGHWHNLWTASSYTVKPCSVLHKPT